MMPASAPSCWAQGLQPRRTTNMPFGFLLRVGFYGRDHRGSPILLPRAYPLPNTMPQPRRDGGIRLPASPAAAHAPRAAKQPRRERPSSRAAEQRDELAARHSITSSASSRNDSGIERPSALAVLRLTHSLNFVGWTTGRSAGFSPRRIRAT